MAARAAVSPATRRFRSASSRTVLVVLGCLVLALLAGLAPLGRLSHQSLISSSGGGTSGWAVLPFGVVGFVVAWRRPRNRLGWIFVSLVVAAALATLAACMR